MELKITAPKKPPYKVVIKLSEVELSELQDIMHTVSVLERQFTPCQRELAERVDKAISKVWED